MKKIIIIFILLITQNVFAFYNTDIPNACTATNMYAQYEAIQYTCLPGYFLPANTSGCRQCPSGYICDGGSFYANPKRAQGLKFSKKVSNNINKACNINLKKMMAVFVPDTENIVNINWNDGENTTTTSCMYGETFALPPTPTRVGYVFTGWKVKN